MLTSCKRMRHRIVFQSRSLAKDGSGGQSTVWTTVFTAFAALEPAFGRELLSAEAMHIDQPLTISTRWRKEFNDPKAVCALRAVYGTRMLNIHSCVNQEERNRIVVLICSEGMNDG